MFRYVGIGDQAGSGIPKILDSWHSQHWRTPELEDTREPYDQTIMRMRMVDLFPADLVIELQQQVGSAYDSLCHEEQTALVIAAVENTVTHARLAALGQLHAADASTFLRSLVDAGHLVKTGSSRGTVYHIRGTDIPGPEDVFDSPGTPNVLQPSSPNLEPSSRNLELSSRNLEASSRNLDPSSRNLNLSSSNLARDEHGRLVADSHSQPFVDDLEQLAPAFLDILNEIAVQPQQKKKISGSDMESVLLKLVKGQFVTLSCLSILVFREPETLRRQYLARMVKSGIVSIAFPKTPNDPRQAYIKTED